MPANPLNLAPQFKKKVLSSFIRNGCKRRLRLSLYSHEARIKLGMAPDQEARSVMGQIGEMGKRWQDEKIEELGLIFNQENIVASPSWPESRAVAHSLKDKLSELRPYQFVVEAEYDSNTLTFRRGMNLTELADEHGRKLGLGVNQADLIQVFPARCDSPAEEDLAFCTEVHPSGELTPIAADDPRLRLRVIDIKMASEPGANYFAEVVYYGLTLASWLHDGGHNDKFVVIAASAVWPGSYVDSNLTQTRKKILAAGESPTLEILATALEADLEIAHFETFVSKIRRFFNDTLPTVLNTPLADLVPFVNYSCQGCEFMGYPWEKDGVKSHHDLWCWPLSKQNEHLSMVFGLSRGNAIQLKVKTLSELAALPPDAPVFRDNATLRTQSTRFPGRAKALLGNLTASLADAGSDSLMPQWPDLKVYLFLDYDIASAVTITFGIRAYWLEPLPFESPIPPSDKRTESWDTFSNQDEVYVVEARDLEREEQEFLKFLKALRKILNRVISLDNTANQEGRRTEGNGWKRSTYQIYLWDEAQRRHLQRLVGRHLNAIIRDPSIRDMAWLFPSAELLAQSEKATSKSPFTLLSIVVQNTVAVPLPHHYTLFGVAQHYHGPDYTPPVIHPLYHDPLSDLIPGERIHELWGKKASRLPEKQNIILRTTRFKLAAMQIIAEQLAHDLGNELLPTRLAAPTLGTLPTRELGSEPPFSQLLFEHARLNVAINDLDGYTVRAMPPHEREARFRSAILTRRLIGREHDNALQSLQEFTPRDLGAIPGLMIYELNQFSRELNARAGDIGYALSPLNQPHFLLNHPYPILSPNFKVVGPGANPQVQTIAGAGLTAVSIEAIDRVNGTIALKPDTTSYIVASADPDATQLNLEDARLLDLSTNVILDKFEFDGITNKVKSTLKGIGYPAIAYHNPAMRRALGIPQTQPTTHSDPTPAARFLWDGPAIAAETAPRQLAAVRTELEPILQQLRRPLNSSQWSAWEWALTHRLSLIWGPPGTGKSQTLRALLVGALLDANKRGITLRILVSSNTYAATDNVFDGLPELLTLALPAVPVDIFRLESESKDHPSSLDASIISLKVQTRSSSPEVQAIQRRLDVPQGLMVVGSTPHQIHNLAIAHSTPSGLTGARRDQATQRRWFDLIIIDEASQMDVASATLVVSKAAEDGAYVLAGDDLQLPPIQAAEAPQGLKHFLGSIFEYTRHVQEVIPNSLDINYRSNKTLVDFTRRANYSDNLQAYSEDLALDLAPLPTIWPPYWHCTIDWSENWGQLLNPAHPATAFTYSDEVSGQANSFEVDTVAAVALLLRNSLRSQLLNERQLDGTIKPASTELHTVDTFWSRAIGIVTPHKAQMSKIVERLQDVFHDDNMSEKIRSAVDTVERFQGQQRDVIIASFGIGDPDLIKSEDEFLFSLRRFNVLASRARAKLIVLAPQSLIDHLSNDAKVLFESHLFKGYVESYCHHITPLELPAYLGGPSIPHGRLRQR